MFMTALQTLYDVRSGGGGGWVEVGVVSQLLGLFTRDNRHISDAAPLG